MTNAYLLSGAQYARYDVVADHLDAGYPKPISSGWSGLAEIGFADGIDAALDLAGGRVYLFKGANYVRVDQQSNAADAGYPLSIADMWPGLAEAGFAQDINAAVNWGNGKAYFLKGDQYLSYDITADRTDDGYPQPVAGNWPGMAEAGFAQDIDAAVNWGNGKAYFFKGDQYLRYDVAANTADDGYPRPLAGQWPGLAESGIADHIDAVWVKLEPKTVDGAAASGDAYNGWVRVNDDLHVGGTLAWRNNNPGNLLPGRMPYRNALAIDRRGLAIFASFQDGWTALHGVLRSPTYARLSMADALEKYAPKGHGNNDPALYAKRVQELTGIDPSRQVGDLSDAELDSFMKAIEKVEGFTEGQTFRRGDANLPPELSALFG